jgi:hypothetical protein
MYSRLCPWLLTWSDYEEDYDKEGDMYDDVSQSVTCTVVGMTQVIDATLVSAAKY